MYYEILRSEVKLIKSDSCSYKTIFQSKAICVYICAKMLLSEF